MRVKKSLKGQFKQLQKEKKKKRKSKYLVLQIFVENVRYISTINPK